MQSAYNNLTGLSHYLESIVARNIRTIGRVLLYSQATIGDYKLSARESDAMGWLVCDGRLLDREQYPALFEVIGTTFGSTNSTNFRLPDYRGRVFGAAGTGAGLTARAVGDAVGTETHVLTVNEMPSHNHGGATASNGAHTHNTNAVGGDIGLAYRDGTTTITTTDNSPNEVNLGNTQALTIDVQGQHAHTLSAQGGGAAHNTMQPTLFGGNVLIFAGLLLAEN